MTGGLTLEVAGESSSGAMHVQGAESQPNSDAEHVVGAVCYLDFDGVLNSDAVYKVRGRGIVVRDSELFEWAHFLEEALVPYPHLRIVLSTSWVRELRLWDQMRPVGWEFGSTDFERLAGSINVPVEVPFDELGDLAKATFESGDETVAWLRRPHPMLEGQSPLECAKSAAGARQVKDMLVAIKHGGVV
jgi:hypothetical protein